uniref:Uncharacterized protein n=1 Tax=Panagrolaimus sp. PS1159 TaxID=55785 RepID=A0AC35EUN7_9BILA
MSHKSGEAHRALERLESYHAELTRTSDRELKREIEKIIAIFKSQLFRNLCAIYDFQDDVLLNEHISFDEKVRETKRFAERWENNPPFGAGVYKSPLESTGLSSTGGGGILDRTFDKPYTNGFDSHSHGTTNQSSYTFQEQKRELTRDGWATQDYLTKTVDGPGGVQTQTTSSSNLIDSHGQEWDIVDVVIEKNQTGLGFSISGGRDRTEGDPHVHVTDISPGGAVARDGRIKVNDIILKVNNVDCVDVDHQIAVDALKSSGPVVRLLVKRPKPTRSVSQSNLTDYNRYPLTNTGGTTGFSSFSQTVTTAPPPLPVSHHHHSPISSSTTQQRIPIEIQRLELNPNVRKAELIKGPSGLGFSIAGGYGNQHVAGDNGIFVTRIIENSAAYFDGRIRPMDKILAVDNIIFDNVTHEFAVNTLKSTGNRVTIYYEKNPYPDYVPPPIDDSSRSITGIGIGNRSQSSQQFGGSQSHLAYIQQPELQPRVVTLRKGDGGLGFNIVGGEDGEPVYVSHVLPGGVADLSGNVRKGDVLLQVNDVDLRSSTHNHAALALKNCPPNTFVNLTLHYQPNEYSHFEQKVEALRNDMLAKQAAMSGGGVATPGIVTAQRRDVYVRALFDNDPSRDAGVPHRALPFNYGDILHVVNSNDDDWWTARRVTENGEEGQEGVIPSKKRVEKREKQRRKQVNFNAGSQSLGRNASMGGGLDGRRGSRSQLSFSRKFPFVKSTEKLNEYTDNELNTVDEPIFSYETVELQNINYVRPVIVLGGLKDRINDELVGRHPERFSSCVPHTSRPPRDNEVNGRDYYFVSKSEMEADVRNNMFIEAGQFQDNLYGTSIKAVRDVAQAGRHCILDVSANAIKRLQNTANIYPIAILVKPQNAHQIREWDPSQNEAEAQRSFERIQRIEQNFGDLFTAVIGGYNLEDILHKIISTINEQSRQRIWVPNRQPLF